MHSCFPAEYVAEFVTDPPGLPSDFVVEASRFSSAESQRIRIETDSGIWTVDVPVEADIPRRALYQLLGTPDSEIMVAVVGGTAYRVPVNTPSDIRAMELGASIVEFLCAVAEGLLIFATDWRITAISENGIQWQTDRLAIEGIHLEDARGARLWAIADPDTAAHDVVIELSSGRLVDPIQAKNLGPSDHA
jgi:hypothetical protein